MSASSASTITCSALLFSFSPTANCNGALLIRFSLTLLGQGNQKKPSAAGAGPITQIGCEAGTDIVAAASDSCNGPYVGQPSVGNSH